MPRTRRLALGTSLVAAALGARAESAISLDQHIAPSGQSPPPALQAALLCTNLCYRAADAVCDDGGPGAESLMCTYGTDCTDCGPREPLILFFFTPPSPPPPPSSTPWLPLPSLSSPPPPAQPPRPAQPGWHVEHNGRRRYPPPRDYAQDLEPGGKPTAFAPPNCSAPGRVGCVPVPRPARPKPAAGVRAALLPPACSLFSEPGCLRLPKPLARTGNEALGSGEVVIQFRDGFAVVPPDRTAITHSIAAADVDGDGDLDVLLGNDGSFRVLLNVGDGTFPTSTELPGGGASTNSIAAADVNGDGDLDP